MSTQKNITSHLNRYFYFYVFLLLVLVSKPFRNLLFLCMDNSKWKDTAMETFVAAHITATGYSLALMFVVMASLFKRRRPVIAYSLFAIGVLGQALLAVYFLAEGYNVLFFPVAILVPVLFSASTIFLFLNITKVSDTVAIRKDYRRQLKIGLYLTFSLVPYFFIATVINRLIPQPSLDGLSDSAALVSIGAHTKDVLAGYLFSYAILSFGNFFFFKHFMLKEFSPESRSLD